MKVGLIVKFDSKILKGLSLVTQIGLLMALPIIGCVIFGGFLDKLLGTDILFLIIFSILGFLSSFRNLFVIGIKYSKKNGEDKDKHE